MGRGSPSRSRSRGRRGGGRSRSRAGGGRRERDRSRSRRRERSRSRSAAAKRRRSRSRSSRRKERSRSRKKRSREREKSKSVKPRKKRSGTPERVPPTSFADYEAAPDGSGWYIYKKTSKWRYHPETGLYLHVKSGVYYVAKDGDGKTFRRIEDDDDHTIRKMKQSEEMRKAIQSTEFVQFDEAQAAAAAASASENEASKSAPAPPAQVAVSLPPEAASATKTESAVSKGSEKTSEAKAPELANGEERAEGRVREWNMEKGFGFIQPVAKEGTEEAARSIFVHLWNVVGSSHANPINLREGAKVQYTLGEQDNRPRALDVVMIGKDGKPLPVHAGAQTLEEKRKSYYVTADTLSVRVHAESWPGKQIELRDRYTIDEPMQELGVYFAVFDGHGGAQVSEIASKQLHKNLLAHFRQKQVQPASRDEKLKAAVKEAFVQTDKEILGLSERKKFDTQGSTALVALLHGNPKLGTALRLVLAHVGDSRAVLCRAGQAVPVSEDHKPDRIDERKRVERSGGLVLNVRGAWRIAAPANPGASGRASRREYQGLAMTRSLGDLAFKQPSQLSVGEPEVKIFPLTEKDLFLVLGTDGIYTHLSNQEVIDCASRHWDDPEEAAKAIVRAAFQGGSDDNLTAVVLQFGWRDKEAPAFIEKRRAAVARGLDGDSPKHKPSVAAAVSAAAALKAVDDDTDIFG